LVTKVFGASIAVPEVTVMDCPTTIPGLAAVNVKVAAPRVEAEAEEATAPPFTPKPKVKVTGVAEANIVALVNVKVAPLIAET
jgi:hypothetical protein